uniref:Ig-like domain-containing protein n=1 Tax=Pundamilia nyererei TaxID=303518 RepID=A0A3B4FWE5_9CICH
TSSTLILNVGIPHSLPNFTVKHSLKYFFTESPGAQSIPEFVAVAIVDDVQIGDSNSVREATPKKDWIKFFEDHPQHLEWYSLQSNESHHFFKATIETLRQRLNQTEGVHILQRMKGCEWDDETGYDQYGYDREDFLAYDLQTLTWIAPKPHAVLTKMRFDAHEHQFESNKNFLVYQCPDFLKEYLRYGKRFLQTAVLPSVSLLQKTPSSPVSCHATGFYPDRAVMFWRKDGVQLHEGVDLGEILLNNDGTFQMSIDLNVSSVTPEDWQRYDCVFQLSGVNEDMITKLDKTVAAILAVNWCMVIYLYLAAVCTCLLKSKSKCFNFIDCYASDNDSLLDLKCVISLRRWQCTKHVVFSK